tara:strand:- start:369 stop:656 length:288 start_codon:yes stop_codon:yes gene_type:complete
MKTIITILKSWWIDIAATGLLGVALLIYGYKLYAGIALGWAINSLVKSLKSMSVSEEVKPVEKKPTANKPTTKKPATKKPAVKKPTTKKPAPKKK